MVVSVEWWCGSSGGVDRVVVWSEWCCGLCGGVCVAIVDLKGSHFCLQEN